MTVLRIFNEDLWGVFATKSSNNGLVQTAPALASFGIIARRTRLGGRLGCFLPHMARVRLHNPSVRATLKVR